MINWLQFEWNVSRVLPEATDISPMHLRPAAPSDLDGVLRAVTSALTMDSSWADLSRQMTPAFHEYVEKAFEQPVPTCMVIHHGVRVVGASVMTIAPDAPSHLLTGPCVLLEYRNRGLGGILLLESLRFLAAAGVPVARGLTRSNSAAARFVYPKFSGLQVVFLDDPLKPKSD